MNQRILQIGAIYKEGCERLGEAHVPDARLDAWYLLEHVTGISKAAYYADPERGLAEGEVQEYFSYVQKRCSRIPLQHLTGEQEFMGLPFYVNEHVLIPRQDTEVLAEKALELKRPGMRVLDMCTGSGCILISLLKLRPLKGISGVGCDISPEALCIAEKNAGRHCVEADLRQGDLFDALPEGDRFDMIVSNPPYIPSSDIDSLQEEVRACDPRIALDGKGDGLYFYKRIISGSVRYIRQGGWLLLEIGCEQAEAVSGMLERAGYTGIKVKKDLAGLDRVVYGMYNGE